MRRDDLENGGRAWVLQGPTALVVPSNPVYDDEIRVLRANRRIVIQIRRAKTARSMHVRRTIDGHIRGRIYRRCFLRDRFPSGRFCGVEIEPSLRLESVRDRPEPGLGRPMEGIDGQDHHDRYVDRSTMVHIRLGQSSFPYATTAAAGNAGIVEN